MMGERLHCQGSEDVLMRASIGVCSSYKRGLAAPRISAKHYRQRRRL